jgi:hypothetical protein
LDILDEPTPGSRLTVPGSSLTKPGSRLIVSGVGAGAGMNADDEAEAILPDKCDGLGL